MACDKTNKLLRILKKQTFILSAQDNDDMDVIVQCRGIFYKFGYSGKDYVEAFNFRERCEKRQRT